MIYLGRDPETGRKTQKWYTVTGTKRKAEQELTRLLRELDTGVYVDPGKITVREYLERWLDDYVRVNVIGKTFERYEEIVKRHLVPALGKILLSKLQPLHIEGYYAHALREGRLRRQVSNNPIDDQPSQVNIGLSAQTVTHHHRVLREALNRATKWQLLARNPADAVEPPKPAKKEMCALNESETAWLLQVALGTRMYVPVLLAVTSGMRRGEFLGLQWPDANLETGTVAVNRSIEQTNAGIRLKSPKGKKGRRIDLPSITIEALREHRASQETQKRLLGDAHQDTGFICVREDGSLWPPDSFTADFARLSKKAGLKVRLHDLRHSHATQLFRQNVHPKIVSERLEHSSIRITLDVYSHVLPGMQEDAALKVDTALRAAIQRERTSRPV